MLAMTWYHHRPGEGVLGDTGLQWRCSWKPRLAARNLYHILHLTQRVPPYDMDIALYLL
jgi:hypothetical protein